MHIVVSVVFIQPIGISLRFLRGHTSVYKKTVTAMDVVYALKRQGRTLYGFGG